MARVKNEDITERLIRIKMKHAYKTMAKDADDDW